VNAITDIIRFPNKNEQQTIDELGARRPNHKGETKDEPADRRKKDQRVDSEDRNSNLRE